MTTGHPLSNLHLEGYSNTFSSPVSAAGASSNTPSGPPVGPSTSGPSSSPKPILPAAAAAAPPPPSAAERKVRRVRTGCLTCRARKVKCDEAPGGCNNCKKRSLVCDFTDITVAGYPYGALFSSSSSSSPSSYGPTGLLESPPTTTTTTSSSSLPPIVVDPNSPAHTHQHRQSACEQCRKARSKCSQVLPRCARCSLRQLDCVYANSKRANDVRLTATARSRIDRAKQRKKKELAVLQQQQQQQQQRGGRGRGRGRGRGQGRGGGGVGRSRQQPHPQAQSVIPLEDSPRLPQVQVPTQAQTQAPLADGPPAISNEILSPAVALHHQPGKTICSSQEPLQHAQQEDPSLLQTPTPARATEADRLPGNVYPYVEAFFTHVACYQTNGFVHRGILRREIRDGRASETLLLAICAVAARFIDQPAHPAAGNTGSPSSAGHNNTADAHNTKSHHHPHHHSHNSQGSRWARLAMQQLMTRTSSITLQQAMAALILCKHAVYCGDFNLSFLLAALANRFALKLRLFDEARWAGPRGGDTEEDDLRWVEKEQRRRVMFACYGVDRATATGLRELTFCPAESIKLQLPCEDHNFEYDIPCITPVPSLEGDEFSSSDQVTSDTVGIMGHYVLLVGIRYVILRYIESLPDPDSLSPWDPASDYMLCVRKLSRWSSNLPARLQLRRENLFDRHGTPQLGPLVMLHLWHDMLHCELYRLALQAHPSPRVHDMFLLAPPGWVKSTRELCVYHARGIARTLAMVQSELGGSSGSSSGGGGVGSGDVRILDPSLAAMCYASIKVQLMGSAVGRPPGLPDPLQGGELLEQCGILFQFVERLSLYSKPAQFLLHEMRSTLHNSGLRGIWSESSIPTSSTQTQDHPWLSRLQQLDHPSPAEMDPLHQNAGALGNLFPEMQLNGIDQFEMNNLDWLR